MVLFLAFCLLLSLFDFMSLNKFISHIAIPYNNYCENEQFSFINPFFTNSYRYMLASQLLFYHNERNLFFHKKLNSYNRLIIRGGQNDDFRPLTYTLGGGGGHGVQGQICDSLTPASYESLTAPSGFDISSTSSIRPIFKCRCPPLLIISHIVIIRERESDHWTEIQTRDQLKDQG
jgi:hypothetical protein